MGAIADELRTELKDPEFSEGYAESFLNAHIATQLKVLRQQRGLKQNELAELVGTKQTAISRIENVNYSKWNIATLKKVARALEVRLKITFEEFGTLPDEVESFNAQSLLRAPRSTDPSLRPAALNLGRVLGISDYSQYRQDQGTVPRKGAASSVATLRQQSDGQESYGTV